MTAAEVPRPDTTDMLAVHGVFRDTLAAAPGLIGVPAATDPARAELLVNFYVNILSFLHAHHHGEDELVFPLLLERSPGDRALIERIAAQHHDVDDLVAASSEALASWQSGDPAARPAVATALSALGERMAEHLDDEERELLPLCAAYLSLPEWGALPAHGTASFRGDKIWLILGLIRERMTDQQRADMLAHMPPPAVDMWTGFGAQAFSELMAEVGAPLG